MKTNSDYCQKISEVLFRDTCDIKVAMLTKDPSICQKLESTVYVSETLEQRKNMCVLLAERKIKDLNCKGYVFCRYLAGFIKDISICEKEENLEFRDSCYYGVSLELLGIYPPQVFNAYRFWVW